MKKKERKQVDRWKFGNVDFDKKKKQYVDRNKNERD
jgi:hypothetical protein